MAAGIRRTVYGVPDPNPHVRGNGAERLRRQAIAVEGGIEAKACAELIAGFAKRVRTGYPLVTLKLAASLDGRIATRTGASRWVTGETARRYVHRLRNEMDAVMVGAGTVIADDPTLTCRTRGGRDPLRVVVDGRLRIPLEAKVLTNEAAHGTLVATVASKTRTITTLRQRGVTVLALPGRRGVISLRTLLKRLGTRGITMVLLEGGATLAAAALRERVVDRLVCLLAPKFIGSDGHPMIGRLGVSGITQALNVYDVRLSRVGEDVLLSAALETDDDV